MISRRLAERAVSLRGTADAYIDRAEVKQVNKEVDEALADSNLALKMAPSDAGGFHVRGRICCDLGYRDRQKRKNPIQCMGMIRRMRLSCQVQCQGQKFLLPDRYGHRRRFWLGADTPHHSDPPDESGRQIDRLSGGG